MIGSEADALLQCFHAPTLADWQGSLQKAGFRIERAVKVILEVNYGPLEDFFDWWVGTSHGVFSPGKIEASDRAALRKMFPGDLLVEHPVLRFVTVK